MGTRMGGIYTKGQHATYTNTQINAISKEGHSQWYLRWTFIWGTKAWAHPMEATRMAVFIFLEREEG